MEWTEEADARLRKMRELGHSYFEIADALGLTKNQVVGRAHRLNLPVGHRRPAKRKAPPAPSSAPARPVAAPRPILPLRSPRPLVLRAGPSPHKRCQFIAGEPRGAATVFCDAPTQRGSSYCPAHHARCWHPRQVAA